MIYVDNACMGLDLPDMYAQHVGGGSLIMTGEAGYRWRVLVWDSYRPLGYGSMYAVFRPAAQLHIHCSRIFDRFSLLVWHIMVAK